MWQLFIVGIALVSSDEVTTCDQPSADSADGKFVAVSGELLVDAPININGPYPETVRQRKQGDQLLVQIRYPIVPPMPTDVAVTASQGRVVPITVARTSSEVAVLERNPRMGGQLGVGYVQILVRAAEPGKELVTLRVKRGDGSIKTVPVAVEIK